MKFLILILLAAGPANAALEVPPGGPAVIDGRLEADEWAAALHVPLAGGEGVYLMHHEDSLYLGIRGAAGGIGSVCLRVGDRVRILHASTGLIEAAYGACERGWHRAHDFHDTLIDGEAPRPLSEVRQSEAYREAALAQFGWTASVVELGPPSEMEYRIALEEILDRTARLSVVFFQRKAETALAVAPPDLADDCLDRELVAGSARDDLDFDTEVWHLIRW